MKRETSAAENFADVLSLLMTREAFTLAELTRRSGHSSNMVRRWLLGMHSRRLIYRSTPGREPKWALQPTPGFYPDAREEPKASALVWDLLAASVTSTRRHLISTATERRSNEHHPNQPRRDRGPLLVEQRRGLRDAARTE